MNVQFTTSPVVLNVMSNKRYGADLVQCDAILLSPPSPKSELPRCFASLLHYQGSYFIICLLAVVQPAGGPRYEIYEQYIYIYIYTFLNVEVSLV